MMLSGICVDLRRKGVKMRMKIVLVGLFIVLLGILFALPPYLNNTTPILTSRIVLSTARNSTVRIEIDDWHTGSGFIVDESGLIITAKHVVDRPGNYTVIFADGAKRKVTGIRMSHKSDCAVLSVSRQNIKALKFTTQVSVGEPIFAIGSPFDIGLENYVTRGIISKIGVRNSFFCDTPLIMVDADGNPGNSGGPVLNMRGKVIGIFVGGYGQGIGIGYVTSAVDFIQLLEGWKDEGANWDDKWEQSQGGWSTEREQVWQDQ